MRTIFFDIETTPLPIAQREFLRPNPANVALGNTKDPVKIEAKIAEVLASWQRGDDAALDPLQSRVRLIGYALGNGPVQQIHNDDEPALLRQFWQVVAPRVYDADMRLIGHCVRFDASMLIHRSWILGIRFPQVLLMDLFVYSPLYWLDTAFRWQLGDRKAPYRKLKHLCAAFGIPVKESPVDGASYGDWWAKDKAACLAYNAQDVEAVRALWRHIGGDFEQPIAS